MAPAPAAFRLATLGEWLKLLWLQRKLSCAGSLLFALQTTPPFLPLTISLPGLGSGLWLASMWHCWELQGRPEQVGLGLLALSLPVCGLVLTTTIPTRPPPITTLTTTFSVVTSAPKLSLCVLSPGHAMASLSSGPWGSIHPVPQAP